MSREEVSDAYSQYGPLVLRRCRRILRDEAAAEDALQDVFIRLWRFGSAFREVDCKVAWLYRVAERCCFDRMKRRTRSVEIAAVADDRMTAPDHSVLAALEDRDLIFHFLNRFDDRVKRVAVLHYLDDLTQEEIAASIGWSRQTVFKKLTLLRTSAARWKDEIFGEGRRK